MSSLIQSLRHLAAERDSGASRDAWSIRVESLIRLSELNEVIQQRIQQLRQNNNNVQRNSSLRVESESDDSASTIRRDIEELWIDIEVLMQLLTQLLLSSNTAEHVSVITPIACQCVIALFLCLSPATVKLHSVVLQHLSTLRFAGKNELIVRLVREHIQAKIDGNFAAREQTAAMAPVEVHVVLSTPAVMQVAGQCLRSLSSDELAGEVQQLFDATVIPLFQQAIQRAHSSLNESPFTSLFGLISRHLFPHFFSPSNPLHQRNLRSMFLFIQSIDAKSLEASTNSLLPCFLLFLDDFFASLTAVMENESASSATGSEAVAYFNSLLVFAQFGLASGESYLIKQSLSILLQRAKHLYDSEGGQQQIVKHLSKLEASEFEVRGNRNQQKRESDKTISAAINAVETFNNARVSRHSLFPDYTLSTWMLYDTAFQVLINNYELHLVQQGFAQNFEAIVREHELWYQHSQRIQRAKEQPQEAVSFTPDIFLELLLKHSLKHDNPYVRKFFYKKIFVSIKDRVRLSIELLFDPASNGQCVSNLSTASLQQSLTMDSSLLHVASSYVALLPCKPAIYSFWQSQFNFLATNAERAQFLMVFLQSLSYQQAAGKLNVYLGLYLNFIANVQFPSDVEESSFRLSLESLMSCLYSLSRSILTVAHTFQSSIHRVGLFDALAFIYLRYSHIGANHHASNGSAAHARVEVRELAKALVCIVPNHMKKPNHTFYGQITQMSNAGGWLSKSLLPLVDEYLSGSISLPHGSLLLTSSDVIHSEGKQLSALLCLLPRDDAVIREIASRALYYLHQALQRHSPSETHAMERIIQVLLALIDKVTSEREASAEGASAGFSSVVSSLSKSTAALAIGATTTRSSSAHTSNGLALEQWFGVFLSSAADSGLFLSFLSQQILNTTANPSSATLRGLCLSILTSFIHLFPTAAAVRNLSHQLLSSACEALIASAPGLDPLQECRLLYVAHIIVAACSKANQLAMADSVHPFALSHLLTAPQYLSLLAYLARSSTSLLTKLLVKSTFNSLAAIGSESIDEIKQNYLVNSQRARWALLHNLLHWSVQEVNHQSIFSDHAASSSCYSMLLFQQSPSFLQDVLQASLVDSMEGCVPESFHSILQCLSDTISLQMRFEQVSAELLLSASTSIQPQQQQMLTSWCNVKHAFLQDGLPMLLKKVRDSFEDVLASKISPMLSADCEAPLRWIAWCVNPSLLYTSPPASLESNDHAIPMVYLSLVDFFFHPALFSPSLESLHSAAPQLLKQFLAQLIELAQRYSLRTLLYAIALTCAERFAVSPKLGTYYLSELASLLTLEKRVESGGGAAGSGSDVTTSGTTDSSNHLPAAIPIEHLIRVIIMSLFEHVTAVANSPSSSASDSDEAYFFSAHAMQHFLSFNFHSNEYSMNQCGGERRDGSTEESDEVDGATSSSDSVPSASAQLTKAHRALTCIWHALCVLSKLQLRASHCHLDDGIASNAEIELVDSADSSQPHVKKPGKAKYKDQKKNQELVNANTLVFPLPASYPLLHSSVNYAFIVLLSPSLTSSVRHLVEIFLINVFTRNLAAQPQLISRTIVPYLDRTIYRQNIACSLIVIAGFTCSEIKRREWNSQQQQQQSPSLSPYAPLLDLLLSKIHVWTQSSLGQIRTIAQYFFYQLFIELYHQDLFIGDKSVLPKGFLLQAGLASDNQSQASIRIQTEPIPVSALPIAARSNTLLWSVYFPSFLFLYRSSAIATLRIRQDQYFRMFQPFQRVTVQGLLTYGEEIRRSAKQSEENEDEEFPQKSAVGASSKPASGLSFGSELPAVDLLHHLRGLTSQYLLSLRGEREFAYYSDRQPKPESSIASQSAASPSDTSSSSDASVAINFQKKIAPLRSQVLASAQEAEQQEMELSAQAAAMDELPEPESALAVGSLPASKHLIVCASLVSNLVNLGGLCRTAEIMKCDLVVEDQRILNDINFTGTSATAHKWAKISVCSQQALPQWLKEMKQQGYSVIGLEQTVHSTPLQSFRFPDRVILILGNERRGVPASILNLLDSCIIIPQFGFIRSLNVHVSGGMVVWQYVAQALLEQEAIKSQPVTGTS